MPTDRLRPRRSTSRRFGLRRIPFAAAAVLALTAVGIAFAAGSRPTLTSVHNAKLSKTIVVGATGQTVYALRPETSHHLLCTPKACFQFWPPVTVRAKSALKAGAGVKGRLGVLRRGNGQLQVTLGGLPLYRFLLDHGKKGSANGQGVQSFGGTWHVIAGTASKTSTTQTTTTQTTTSPIPGY
jgi:predicted lipoprotein with Yx(FWY)xxD motif